VTAERDPDYAAAVRRRISNPPNPWSSTHVEWLGEPPPVAVVVHEERAKTILSENDSEDVPFRWSANPYRGCQHACAYCYARPTHEYLGLGAGTDFDSQLVVKTNAAALLRAKLGSRGWRGEAIAFSGVTDPYQPIEASFGVTRQCLEVCSEFGNPFGVITKSALIRRDVELLARAARRADVRVFVSIPFADAGDARAIEPYAASPEERFATLRALSEAGVPTGVAIAPVIPALNEHAIPEILERAREAGATRAFQILLRLPGAARGVFEERLRERFPDRAAHVLSALTEMRGANLNRNRGGGRTEGHGARWRTVAELFALTCRRLGYTEHEEGGAAPAAPPSNPIARTRRAAPGQGELFD
jgi:DNA repair photolyase